MGAHNIISYCSQFQSYHWFLSKVIKYFGILYKVFVKMKSFCILLITSMLAIDVQKGMAEYLLVEIDHNEGRGAIPIENRNLNPKPAMNHGLEDKKVIECCKQKNVPEGCMRLCGIGFSGATNRLTGCYRMASRIEGCKRLKTDYQQGLISCWENKMHDEC